MFLNRHRRKCGSRTNQWVFVVGLLQARKMRAMEFLCWQWIFSCSECFGWREVESCRREKRNVVVTTLAVAEFGGTNSLVNLEWNTCDARRKYGHGILDILHMTYWYLQRLSAYTSGLLGRLCDQNWLLSSQRSTTTEYSLQPRYKFYLPSDINHIMFVDYSLYLVTDSSPAILGDKSLLETVEAAIKGGTEISSLSSHSNDGVSRD